ncbi:hypothetical protein P9112_008571 [Eukaryota sp. TZLM1-RC]
MPPIDTTIHSSRTDEDCDLPWRQSDDQQFGNPIKLPRTDEDFDFPWRQSCAQQLDFSSVNSPLHTAPYVNPHLNEVDSTQSHQPLYFSFVHNDGCVALKLYLLYAPYKGTHKFFYEGEHDVYIQQAESYSHLVLDDLVLLLTPHFIAQAKERNIKLYGMNEKPLVLMGKPGAASKNFLVPSSVLKFKLLRNCNLELSDVQKEEEQILQFIQKNTKEYEEIVESFAKPLRIKRDAEIANFIRSLLSSAPIPTVLHADAVVQFDMATNVENSHT